MKGRYVIIWILILLFGCSFGKWMYDEYEYEKEYKEAIELIVQGEYQAAFDQLEEIQNGDYKDASLLKELCNAHLYYEEGNYEYASWRFPEDEYKYLLPKQREQLQIDSFREQVETAYDRWYEAEKKRIEKERELKEEREYRQYLQEKEAQENSKSNNSTGTYTYNRKKYRSKYYDDPYDVYEYNDPEDFYYDNEDDFDGAEDAEDYWDEAWDYRSKYYNDPEDFYYDNEDDFDGIEDAEDYLDGVWN